LKTPPFTFTPQLPSKPHYKDLGPVNRPYNAYAIPAEKTQLYVYLLPAQTDNDVYPLGGDVRYTFSADGLTILEKRQMHKSVLEFKIDKTTVAGSHSHVLTLSPEDSDVFYVLTRKPSIPEYVGTLNRKIYIVQTDGTIHLGK
jgi:hydrogenase maturation factor